MKVLSVFGTRPEAIKMAPVVRMLNQSALIESKIAVTAQHREMLDQVLELFDIHPDYDLNLMRHGQSLSDITTAVLHGIGEIIADEKPDLVLVHGDTSTTFAAALAAFYQQTAIGHVEAGLRTDNKYAPFPEEINRRLTGALADFHFAPTIGARDNLLKENIARDKIFVTGNTVIDALLQVVDKPCLLQGIGLDDVDWSKRQILLTCHRRENWGEPMRQIFTAVRAIAEDFTDCEIIFPVHKNPDIRRLASEVFDGCTKIHRSEPLDYLPFSHIMNKSYLVLTDSGGLQEEAPALGKPVIVLRDTTERPEAIDAGTAILAGSNNTNVYNSAATLLSDNNKYQGMAHAVNPFGDGQAAARILSIITG